MKTHMKKVTVKAEYTEISVKLPETCEEQDLLDTFEGIFRIVMGWVPKGKLEWVDEE